MKYSLQICKTKIYNHNIYIIMLGSIHCEKGYTWWHNELEFIKKYEDVFYSTHCEKG